MLAFSMSQKSSCDKFLGERFCEHIRTLGGASRPVIAVTTLGSNGAVVVSLALIIFCDLVCHCWCTERPRLDGINWQGFCFQRCWQVHLKVQEFELFEICF
jgi:hypothetical protein